MKKRIFLLASLLVFPVGLARADCQSYCQRMWELEQRVRELDRDPLARARAQRDYVAALVVKLRADLNLTDQQAEKVQGVLEDIYQREWAAEGAEQQCAHYKKLMQERDARLKEILTAEQFTRYQQSHEPKSKQGKEQPAPQSQR